jgi:diguanylate cyclase (GGDEF)-like protein
VLVAPLVEQLRAAMKSASAGMLDSSGTVAGLGATGLVLQGSRPASVSVKPIVAYSSAVKVPPGSEYLHVSIRRVDDDVLSEISAKYHLEGLRLMEVAGGGDPHATIPIPDGRGRILGFLIWDGYRPGTNMVMKAGPGLLAAIGVGAGLLLWLLYRLRRSSAQLSASQAQTQFLAFHDTLTGLPNRALFEDRLDRALVEARRSGKKIALHAIDIDRFKNVNDTRGHPAGDELIRLVAARLSSVMRESDTVARLGGDEFAVVQTDVGHLGEAESAAARMLEAICEPCELFGEKAHVTASVGVVVSAAAETSREEMFRKADIALYEAKGRGRARYQLFAGDMDDNVKRRRLIEDELRLALELGNRAARRWSALKRWCAGTIRSTVALPRTFLLALPRSGRS